MDDTYFISLQMPHKEPDMKKTRRVSQAGSRKAVVSPGSRQRARASKSSKSHLGVWTRPVSLLSLAEKWRSLKMSWETWLR